MSQSQFRIALFGSAIAMTLSAAGVLAADQTAFVGHLIDNTGPTSDVGTPYGQGIDDALAYVNRNGGVDGVKLNVNIVDYGYQVPRAVAQYKKWTGGAEQTVAIQGWGTADTEALSSFVTQDQIPYYSGSYSAALTDPQNKSGKGKGGPYNFFYGPSYSDAVRAMLYWAAEDWKSKGKPGKPKFVHMGANHPYPNSPKAASEALAAELGFDVVPAVQFAMTPGDYTPQCLTIMNAGVDYAYLGNTAGSNISVLKACKAAGAKVQFLGNVFGMDENSAKTGGEAADGAVFPVRTGIVWNDAGPAMKTLREISAMSNPSGDVYRPVHYLAGVCSAMYMAEAMEWAAKNGGITGPNIQKAMYQKKNWVPKGMEGVCLPSSWAADDHRGLMTVNIYRMHVKGPTTEGSVGDLVKAGTIKLEHLKAIELERKPELLGW